MFIFPAIDILNSQVVRLYKGDYDTAKSYSDDCGKVASAFSAQGAKFIHAVDLDGAKSGKADNADSIKDIIDNSGCFVEVGGVIRSFAQIDCYLSAGAGRVIIGTAAVCNFGFAESAVKNYGSRVAVGVDSLGGKVAVSGWREVTDINSFDFCKRLAEAGVENVIYTDISRDGTLSGTDLDAYERLMKIEGLKITASGGVASLGELRVLKQIGVYGVILGKSLYEGRLELKSAIDVAEN